VAKCQKKEETGDLHIVPVSVSLKMKIDKKGIYRQGDGRMRKKTGDLFSFLVRSIAGIGVMLCIAGGVNAFAQSKNVSNPVSPQGSSMEDAIIKVANLAGKSVVSISTEQVTRIPGGSRFYFNLPHGRSPFDEDEALRRFFDDFLGQAPERSYKRMGLGSGVIIDPEGYILTNAHVVGEGDKITVILPDGREFKGAVRGKDVNSDLAVIKIDAHDLPAAALGNSDDLKIGEWVVAIGNPFGFALQNPEPTVTVGVVSALHRFLGSSSLGGKNYNDLIQTDAAINPGNSGGPLVNLKGQVVGINVAIFSTSGGFQGVGFAMPINNAKNIIARLREGKKIQYGWLGVTVQDLNDALSGHFALPDTNGALVSDVIKNSPAEKGGIKEGDVIRKFDDALIKNSRQLFGSVNKAEVGRKVKVTVMRQGKELNLPVEITEMPREKDAEKGGGEETGGWRGLEVQELTPELIKKFGIKDKNGVLVVNVEPQSPADNSGLIPGDVILGINGTPVSTIEDYGKITGVLTGEAFVKTSRGFFIIK
jgi:serine protease Do